MQSISTVQGNLAAMAREVEVAQKKADKLRDKGARHRRGRWPTPVLTSRAPANNGSHKHRSSSSGCKLDETRLNHLRDVLTQFQTHEVDQVERNRLTAESCLNVLLNVETADEIKAFAVKTAGGRPGAAPKQKSRTTTGGTLSPPTPSGLVDDGASERSGISGGAGNRDQVRDHIAVTKHRVTDADEAVCRPGATSWRTWRTETTGDRDWPTAAKHSTGHTIFWQGDISRKADAGCFQ
jgi:hypothetical protein